MIDQVLPYGDGTIAVKLPDRTRVVRGGGGGFGGGSRLGNSSLPNSEKSRASGPRRRAFDRSISPRWVPIATSFVGRRSTGCYTGLSVAVEGRCKAPAAIVYRLETPAMAEYNAAA